MKKQKPIQIAFKVLVGFIAFSTVFFLLAPFINR